MNNSSVFTNSCIKVPVDPINKMPKAAYERTNKTLSEHSSIDSSTTCSVSTADVDTEKVKLFYRSIPDYNEINHLSSTEFYSTLKSLREKKKSVLGLTVEPIDNGQQYDNKKNSYDEVYVSTKKENIVKIDNKKSLNTVKMTRKKTSLGTNKIDHENVTYPTQKQDNINDDQLPGTDSRNINKVERSHRNHSACSISWHDDKNLRNKNEVDKKFDKFFHVTKLTVDPFDSRQQCTTQSMPSSPLRTKSLSTIFRKNKNITIPKPFKMTERDDQERIANDLRTLQKSFSEDMLNQKRNRKQFRARPVPIESRIPLYDKILEDQAMRRAITKINSEAELRAQMKPFSFTKREENGTSDVCERAVHVLPKPKKKKRFRARPVPKNLFSNYIYDKMKQDHYFRSINRRIRAEEMLRSANYPGNMATRERSRLSTPAAHSDLPIDPSPAAQSTSSSDRLRCASPTKSCKTSKEDFITTSPQPFRFKTASRANQKMQNIAKKIYQSNNYNSSITDCVSNTRAYSALELRSAAAGRSNLAALLRAESVKRKFEMEAAKSLAEQRRRIELRQRDRILRSKPAWHLVKNNHEEEIAIRLQTRRDEERMRREEFLHEMELMYGRVQQQPLLFERYYAPRSYSPGVSIQLSPRKCSSKKRSSRRNRTYQMTTPSDGCDSDGQKCIDKIEKDDNFFVNSRDVTDSVDRSCL